MFELEFQKGLGSVSQYLKVFELEFRLVLVSVKPYSMASQSE